jgi:predicted metal-binding membrane protein
MAMSSGPAPFSLTATMWAVMMVGMMLPSALPMILLFTMVQRRQGDKPVLMNRHICCGVSADLGWIRPGGCRAPNRAWERSFAVAIADFRK